MIYASGYVWGGRSQKVLAELAPDLRHIMDVALSLSHIDFGLVKGARTIEQQREYFRTGASKVNPDAYATEAELYAAAKHVVGPGMPLSRAVDIVIAEEGHAYDIPHLCHVAGVIRAVARSIDVHLRWGGDWDEDGVILYDQKFDDGPHFELMAQQTLLRKRLTIDDAA